MSKIQSFSVAKLRIAENYGFQKRIEEAAAESAAAAKEAVAIVRKYGDVTQMPYNEEYGNIANALQDFATLGEEKQKLCYIDAWVSELQVHYDELTAAQSSRTEEQGAKTQGIVKQARTACDDAYRTLVNYVNAMAAVTPTAYATFIEQANVIINEAQATLAARSTRNAKKSTAATTVTSETADKEL